MFGRRFSMIPGIQKSPISASRKLNKLSNDSGTGSDFQNLPEHSPVRNVINSSFVSNSSSENSMTINDMILALDSDIVKDKFKEFSEKTHISENEKFVSSVQYYRENYCLKSDSGKKNMCLRIVKTFIEVDSVNEINISDQHRKHILENVKFESENTVPSIDIFDEAFNEITRMLFHGPWRQFLEKDSMEFNELLESKSKEQDYISKIMSILSIPKPRRPKSFEKTRDQSQEPNF
jgi:hypothetical protein